MKQEAGSAVFPKQVRPMESRADTLKREERFLKLPL